MRAAAKDVHKIRGQSRKEVPEVQTFRYQIGSQFQVFFALLSRRTRCDRLLCDSREKMAFFTRAKTSIPDLPADDV